VNPRGLPSILVEQVPADAVLLDVREDDEWAAGHIDGAVHIPMNTVPARLADDPVQLSPDASIVVVCAVGGRSAHVTAWLNEHGYDAVNLTGGMHAWADARRPMVSDTGAAPTVL
jgi:rhodanese-related sulfurtransferase